MTEEISTKECSLVKDVILSGLFIGSIEPCIEDAVIFSAKGLVSISNLPILAWIGCIELVGLGQILLLSRCFKNGKRLKAAIVLWILITPLIFVSFTLGSFLSTHLQLVNIWGPVTIVFVAALVVGVPAYLPNTSIPIAYISLFIGVVADSILSLITLEQPFVLPVMTFPLLSEIFLSCLFISLVMGITLILFSYLSDCAYIKVTNHMKKKLERDLKTVASAYLIVTGGFLMGSIPAFVPLLTLMGGFLVVTLIEWKGLEIEWKWVSIRTILKELI